jgi:nucleoside-diphosphate-sugar epimerase
MRRILVTGAAGFIGSHVCEYLLDQGHDVVGLDSFVPYYPRAIKERNLQAARSHPRFQFFDSDLRFDPLDTCLNGVDGVIHGAAMPGLPRSWTDFHDYVTCNLLGTQRLLEASRVAGVRRFVCVSTSSVYGAHAVGDEQQPTEPVSPYGVTKLAAEQLVLAYVREFEFPALILRYFSIYGPRQRPDMAYHIFISSLIDGRPITVYGDGSQTRSSTYVTDCVHGTLLALREGRVGEVYNIGGGAVVILAHAIDLIADALGVIPLVNFAPRRTGDQRHTQANISKARQELGFEPLVSPAEGLRVQVAWQLAHHPDSMSPSASSLTSVSPR